ncbi:MAG: PHP domain-containing protein [Syntrophomonadaceae bacterium]
MKFFGDYHMHTTYSDGRATVEEMVEAGQNCGLEEIGLADHGPRNIGTGVKNEKTFLLIKDELNKIQEAKPEIKLSVGAEANIINPAGDLDLTREVIKDLDYLIVGLHPFVRPRGSGGLCWLLGNQLIRFIRPLERRVQNANTKALVEAIYKHKVWAISHPGLKMPIEIAEVARACIARGTAWEINTGHKHPCLADALAAARSGVDFVVNSDAHFPETVGSLEYGSWVLEKAGVDPKRVLNAYQN